MHLSVAARGGAPSIAHPAALVRVAVRLILMEGVTDVLICRRVLGSVEVDPHRIAPCATGVGRICGLPGEAGLSSCQGLTLRCAGLLRWYIAQAS